MELHDKYLSKVEASDQELEDEIKTLEVGGVDQSMMMINDQS